MADPPSSGATTHVAATTIRHTLPCTTCGYDLEGLEARGVCPECGTPIVESLTARLDAATARFEDMPNPRRVSATVLVGSIGALGGSCIFTALVIGLLAESTGAAPLRHAIDPLRVAALVATALGLAGFVAILPWRRESRFIRAKAFGSLGFLAWMAAALVEVDVVSATYCALPATLVLFALAPLLRALAPRSRAYRNARATAQRVEGLLLSNGLAGSLSATALFLSGTPEASAFIGVLRAIALAAAALTVIGLAYLVLNAAWLARASLRPLLSVEETFGNPASPPSDDPRNMA
jgi:predicted RNA-binding Zn-ribbon protein involved in translation (DUF1610 family)